MIRNRIEEALLAALNDLGVAPARLVVERPRSFMHGDYATNAALVAKVDAHKLVAKLKIEGIDNTEVVGKFINFFLSREAIVKEVEAAAKEENWGTNGLYKGRKEMVEYTDPNPFKEFHIGHLMSNAIGESVSRLLELSGAEVKRANYQGDVGPHVAKAIWGKMQILDASWGKAYVYGNEQYEVKKEEIDSINKKIYERSDEQVNKLYDEGRKVSLEHFEDIYKTLGTKFDYYFFESETAPIGLQLVEKHPDIFEKSDEAVIFRGDLLLHTRVFVTSRGLPKYEAKELGLAKLKQEKYPADEYVYITANEQEGFFSVVFAVIKQIFRELDGRLTHRSHGMMRFAEGKMSSRKGNVITGESLLADLKEAAKEKMQGRELLDADKVAEQVAVGAIKYAVLKQGSGKDIIFDPEKSLSLEGDSGPYVQYAHTRALSLVREAEKAGIAAGVSEDSAAGQQEDASLSETPARSHLERLLLHYPDVVARAAQELEPHYVTTYITELASAFNSWYASERVIGGSNPHYGVLLAQAVEQTLKKGLTALGIPAPEKM